MAVMSSPVRVPEVFPPWPPHEDKRISPKTRPAPIFAICFLPFEVPCLWQTSPRASSLSAWVVFSLVIRPLEPAPLPHWACYHFAFRALTLVSVLHRCRAKRLRKPSGLQQVQSHHRPL